MIRSIRFRTGSISKYRLFYRGYGLERFFTSNEVKNEENKESHKPLPTSRNHQSRKLEPQIEVLRAGKDQRLSKLLSTKNLNPFELLGTQQNEINGKTNTLRNTSYTPRHISRFTFAHLTPLISSSTLDGILNGTYSYDKNYRKTPFPGSLIEIGDSENEPVLAVVMMAPRGRLRPELSRMLVYTLTGEFKFCPPAQAAFHLPSFYDPMFIRKCGQDPRALATLQISLEYVSNAAEDVTNLLKASKLDDAVYCKLARPGKMAAVSIDRYLDELPLFSRRMPLFTGKNVISNRKRLVVHLAIYRILERDYKRYVVSPVPTANPLVPCTSFYVLSLASSLGLKEFCDRGSIQSDIEDIINDKTISQFACDVRDMALEKPSVDPNNMLYRYLNGSTLTPNQRRIFDVIFSVLRLYVSYPHPKLANEIAPLWSQVPEGHPLEITESKPLNQESVLFFLKYFGVYTETTDPVLSSGVLFKDTPPVETVPLLLSDPKCDTREYKFAQSYLFAADQFVKEDTFLVLRESRVEPAFGLFKNGVCGIAVSTEETPDGMNFNIHVPDLASFIRPDSSLFQQLLQVSEALELPNGTLEYMLSDLIHHYGFKTGSGTPQPCVTFSLPQDLWRRGGFQMEEIKVSLEYLDSVRVLTPLDILSALKEHVFGFFREDEDSKEMKATLSKFFSLCKVRSNYRNNMDALEWGLEALDLKVLQKDNSMSIQAQGSKVSDDWKVSLLYKELPLLLDEMAAKYAGDNKIPVLHWLQDIDMTIGSEKDHVLVRTDTAFVSSYAAWKYEDFFFRKIQGRLPPGPYFCAQSFVMPKEVTFLGDHTFKLHPDRVLGLEYGRVKQSSIFLLFEQLLNQQQIVMGFYRTRKNRLRDRNFKQALRFEGELERRGYIEKTPSEVKDIFHKHIYPISEMHLHLKDKSERFWATKYMEDLASRGEFQMAKCVVSRGAEWPELAEAYCVELGVSVGVKLEEGESLAIGDTIICLRGWVGGGEIYLGM